MMPTRPRAPESVLAIIGTFTLNSKIAIKSRKTARAVDV